MQILSVCNLLVLLHASASAAVATPKCNADNCLRGLFGSNARSSSANLAACSTGLPTVTVSVDGTSRMTMTGTAALPAAASVCDGQGIERRAARFQSACSCVGIFPSTVTQTAAQTTTQAAEPSEVLLGQLLNADMFLTTTCNTGAVFIQTARTSVGQPYVVPAAGKITSASTFDSALFANAAAGTATFQVWRPVAGSDETFVLVGKSEPLQLTKSSQIVAFTLPQPIIAQAGDRLGMYVGGIDGQNVACIIGSIGDGPLRAEGGLDSPVPGDEVAPLGTISNSLLNVAAVLQLQ